MLLTWISPGGTSVEFSKDSNTYKFLKGYDGFSTCPVTHQTTIAPYQDGSRLIDSKFEPRQVSFDVMVTAPTLEDLQTAIQTLVRVFNPLPGTGYLKFTYEDGTEYYLKAIGNNTPKVSPNVRTRTSQLVTIDLIAHDPFWYTSTQITYLDASSNYTFPLVFPFVLPNNTSEMTCTNDGDIDAPVTIIITGVVTNPGVVNSTTDQSMNFTVTMDPSDNITITTAFGNKTITYYDWSTGITSNGFQYLNPDSILWQLQPGENIITFSGTDIAADTTVSIEWQDRYSGV